MGHGSIISGYTNRPKHPLLDQSSTDGWYLIDFARGRPAGPACTQVSPWGRWY
jgi:hypothetical protein